MAETPPPPVNMDPTLAAILNQALGGSGAPGADPTNLLQQVLFGLSGRQGITSQPLEGILPSWTNKDPNLRSLITGGQIDPYLPMSNDPSSWQVYLGEGPRIPGTVEERALRGRRVMDTETPGGDKTATIGQVANEPFLWSEDEVAEAIKKFQAAGVTSVTDFDSLQKAWGGLVSRAGAMYSMSSGKNKVTPWDVLDLYKNEMSKAGTTPAGPFTGSRSVTNKTVSEISEADAWGALRQTVSRMLGRDPEDQEVRDFTYRMNQLAAANPSISTTTSNYQKDILTSSSTKVKPGFGAADIAREAYTGAQEDPDYAEFQSATTYFNAAVNALGEIGA